MPIFFLVILNKLTIPEFFTQLLIGLFWLELLFGTKKKLKTTLYCGTLFLAKINIYINRYFVGLPATLEANAPSNGITAAETGGSIRV